uniref:Tetratricopeptide repeat domain 6 n=1 Tax=Erpetoichthys calabaricus TaxID=27687 RepID=A0A8C4SYJ6_ERPCA
EMKKFDLARFCIHYAAEMNNALGSSAVQQAAVQSFLQNHEKAIECLTSVTLTHPTASVFVLLGKTQMKAKKYQVGIIRTSYVCALDAHLALSLSDWWEHCHVQAASVPTLCLCQTYRFAIDDLSTAIHLDGTCPLAYYNRGVCYQQTEEYDKALKDYGIVLLLGNSKEVDLKVLINRGLLYVALDDYENALHVSRDANIFHAVGVCHHRIGALEDAVKAFCQAVRRDRFFLDAYVGRGNVYMDFGHQEATKAAQKDFLQALHLNPLCSKARINLGYNLQVCGKFQKAWQQFTVAADLEPTCSAAYEGRAIVNLQMGDTYAAFLDITTALKLLTNRGVINQFMGDIVGAMRDYQQAIRLNPRNALAHFNAANLYFHSRQFQQACEYYTKAVHLDPHNDCAFLNRAITRSLLRDIRGAMEDFQEALRLSPFSAPAYFNRANLYISLKKFKQAEQDLSQALVLQPDDALLYKLRADVRGHLGLTELAVLDYKQALWLEEEEEEGPPHVGMASR